MSDIILHHYPASPFSEKVRCILGFKKLAWSSVTIPTVMPKPDLIALTGGYRKTPVMQIGCDIYCDTKLIANALDRIQPDPPLLIKGHEATALMVEQWSEQVLFFLCVPIVFQPAGMAQFFSSQPPGVAENFQKDRASLFAAGSARRPSMATTRSELPSFLAQLDAQLAASDYLEGGVPSLSDFSIYHPIWFVVSNPAVASYFDGYKNIRRWAARMTGIGHGSPTVMTSEEAIHCARSSVPHSRHSESILDFSGCKAGDTVSVSATDYGADPVIGTLLPSGPDEIVLQREDPRAGTVIVHVPRVGFKASLVK